MSGASVVLKIHDDECHRTKSLDEMKSLGSKNRIETSQRTASCVDLWLNRIMLLSSSSFSKQAFVDATTDGNPGSLITYFYFVRIDIIRQCIRFSFIEQWLTSTTYTTSILYILATTSSNITSSIVLL